MYYEIIELSFLCIEWYFYGFRDKLFQKYLWKFYIFSTFDNFRGWIYNVSWWIAENEKNLNKFISSLHS